MNTGEKVLSIKNGGSVRVWDVRFCVVEFKYAAGNKLPCMRIHPHSKYGTGKTSTYSVESDDDLEDIDRDYHDWLASDMSLLSLEIPLL